MSDDLERMMSVIAPGTRAKRQTKKQPAKKVTLKQAVDNLDGVHAGDMLADEFAALLKAAVERAMQQAMAEAKAPKPQVTTKQAKRITNSPRPGVTFKG
jgi:hypothetical protein